MPFRLVLFKYMIVYPVINDAENPLDSQTLDIPNSDNAVNFIDGELDVFRQNTGPVAYYSKN